MELGRGDLDICDPARLGALEYAGSLAGRSGDQLAAILARVDEARRLALRQSGIHLGIAFQLVDDLLDFTGNEKVLGKPAASDLREGKVTLALIDLLGSGSTRARDLAGAIMDAGEPEMPEIAWLTGLLEESGAVDRVRTRAREHAARAKAELEIFPDGPARRALGSVADLLVFRER